ncbi:MAG: HPr kinase/phosphorylase [Spirochaetes bacterium RBG_16_67_19]|nr:MAG: HPr kinase/phosphorylase [Spirochaetes bacterium GWB1_66_5]OHD75606.1 MAG: HPr kinase/phosphorylase [Spirochaetes bacterium RBG_16_67_19]
MKKITVLDLLQLDLKENEALNLKCIAGRAGLVRELKVPEINRPGLELSGFYENFAFQRIQIFGRGETAYLWKLEREGKKDTLEMFFGSEVPCCVFTHQQQPTGHLLALAESSGCPVLQTDLSSSEFTTRVIRVLSNIFAPKSSVHAVLVEVFGIGVLLMGDSGVGKSEAALALVERNHRLVADDLVEIRRIGGNILMGTGTGVSSHHMEIRGLGIINITHLFGVGAIRDKKQIQVAVKLEEWDPAKSYDRIGAEENFIDILGVQVPHLVIPVKPGRNIPILIETAAMNERLKKMGYYSAKEFSRNVMNRLETESARAIFLNET